MNVPTDAHKNELVALKTLFFKRVMLENELCNLLEIYPQTDDMAGLFDQLTDLKTCLDSFRPLSTEQVAHLTASR